MRILTTFLTIALLCVLACTGHSPPLPEQLGPQALESLQDGEQARTAVAALHPSDLGSERDYIGRYSGGAILYVSVFSDPEAARRDLLKMAMGLAEGAAGFSPVEFDESRGAPVFRTSGHGAHHLFYRTGRLVIWLQHPGSDPAVESDLLGFTFPALAGDNGA